MSQQELVKKIMSNKAELEAEYRGNCSDLELRGWNKNERLKIYDRGHKNGKTNDLKRLKI